MTDAFPFGANAPPARRDKRALKYAEEKPPALKVLPDNIPRLLRERPQWVCWRWVREQNKEKKWEWRKPPFTAANPTRHASSTNPTSWATFERALARYDAGDVDGVGYVLTLDDHLVGIDLDDAHFEGAVEEWAAPFLWMLNSYTEVSVSGTGLRLLVGGNFREGEATRKGNVEIYQTGRYLTFTGQRISSLGLAYFSDLGERQSELNALRAQVFGARPEGGARELSDDELIAKAKANSSTGAKFTALWDGDLAGYSSASEADLALVNLLAFWTGGDRNRIDHLFRQSGLMREKWERHDYRAKTIDKALQGRTAFYRPGPERNGATHAPPPAPAAQRNGAPPPPAPPSFAVNFVTSADFAGGDYRLRWLIPKLLVEGQPCIVGGPRKSLKTSMMVDLAVALGTATPFLGKFPVIHQRRVAMFSGESGEHTLQETALRVCAARGVSLKDADVLWHFRLPQLAKPDHLDALKSALDRHKVEAVIIDPLYLSLLAGTDVAASNLFEMGPLLLGVAAACLDVGCTPLLSHHAKKGVLNPNEPPELDDLAFAGFQEFARQWLLLARRKPYVPGSGLHQLWLSAGGSAGHGRLWGLDIDEGHLDDNFGGRHWQTTVLDLDDVRQERQDDSAAAERSRLKALGTSVLEVLRTIDPTGDGVTLNQLEGKVAKVGRKTLPLVIAELLADGFIEEVPVTRRSGRGGATETSHMGVRLI